ncbi:MAG: pitrilysin family protein [Bryobacteraceae bacterium]
MKSPFLTGLIAVTLAAQTPIDRTKPPETGPLADFKLPPFQEKTLSNGLRVMLINDTRYPMLELRMGFQAGDKFDPADKEGLAETVASLLNEGAGDRNARQVAEELADIGGDLAASATSDFLMLSGYALAEHTDRLLSLADDFVRKPAFAEDELRLRKQNRVEELKAERAESETVATERLHEILFAGHPYEHALPTPGSIAKITREDLVTFRDRFLIPNNAVLAVIGPIGDANAFTKKLQARFGSWKKGAVPTPPAAKFPEPKGSITLVDRPGSVQADILMGRLAVKRDNPDYFPLYVGNAILGTGASSRMFANIREKQGFAYHSSSHMMPRRDAGFVESTTQVRNEVIGPALEAIQHEFRRMGTERVSAEELSAVKNYLSGNFVMSLATPTGVANQLINTRLNGLPNSYLETYVDKIRRVEPDQIQSAGRKYLDPSQATIVVVGDAAQIAEPMKKLGDVKVEKAPQ